MFRVSIPVGDEDRDDDAASKWYDLRKVVTKMVVEKMGVRCGEKEFNGVGDGVGVDDAGTMKRMFRVWVKMLGGVKKGKTLMMMMIGVYMNTMYVCTCVWGSDAEQPAICQQINPGCA